MLILASSCRYALLCIIIATFVGVLGTVIGTHIIISWLNSLFSACIAHLHRENYAAHCLYSTYNAINPETIFSISVSSLFLCY